MRGQRRDSGQATVEAIGVVVVLVLVTLLAVQGIAVAQAAAAAQEAARNGARALSQDRDWAEAVREQVPSGLTVTSLVPDVDSSRARMEVTVSAPLGLAGLTLTSVSLTRSAEFPVED